VSPVPFPERHIFEGLLMDDTLQLLGYCGLYCGACNHYRSSFPEGIFLLNEGIKQGKDQNSFTCKGCRGEIAYSHPGCEICEIKTCAEAQGITHCGLCISFPCETIIEFKYDDCHIHHLDVVDSLQKLKEKGSESWLKEQEEQWTCVCGMPFSWYETKCSKCGAGLSTYSTDLRNKRNQ
jgi:hypothetical protein